MERSLQSIFLKRKRAWEETPHCLLPLTSGSYTGVLCRVSDSRGFGFRQPPGSVPALTKTKGLVGLCEGKRKVSPYPCTHPSNSGAQKGQKALCPGHENVREVVPTYIRRATRWIAAWRGRGSGFGKELLIIVLIE